MNDHKHHDHSHDINRHGDNIESFSLVTNQQISMTTFNFFIEEKHHLIPGLSS